MLSVVPSPFGAENVRTDISGFLPDERHCLERGLGRDGVGAEVCFWYIGSLTGHLNLDTTATFDWTVPCHGSCPVHCGMIICVYQHPWLLMSTNCC